MIPTRKEVLFRTYTAFNRPVFRFLLSNLVAVHASLKVRGRCQVNFENDAWVQEFPGGVLVEPHLRWRVLPEIERRVKDMWMYEYVPRPGDVVLDIGAGTGWETLCFSRLVGQSGSVVSIEAHPRTFECLTEMCRRNSLDNVTRIFGAAAAEVGSLLISNEADYAANRVVEISSGTPVPSLRLDSLYDSLQLGRIDLLKMNIEGAERAALDGMRRAIRRTQHVVISCHDFLADDHGTESMRTRAEVVRFLEQAGFKVIFRTSDSRPYVRDCVYGSRSPARLE